MLGAVRGEPAGVEGGAVDLAAAEPDIGQLAIVERAFWSLRAPVVRVAAPDTPYPIASLEQLYVPSAERALDAVRHVMAAA